MRAIFAASIGPLLVIAAQAAPKEPVIVYHIHGGAVFSYVDDTLKVHPEGRVELSTYSPFPYNLESENSIGQFEGKITKESYRALADASGAYFKSAHNSKPAPNDSVSVELYFAGTDNMNHAAWPLADSPAVKELEDRFYAIKKAAMNKAVSALQLKCARAENLLKCNYVNVGTNAIQTVDPLQVSGSIFCVGSKSKRVVLNPLPEYDPKKMTPRKITIPAGKNYAFEVALVPACVGRVTVKTTDVRLNRAYAGLLLGELVSNPLPAEKR